VVTNPFTGDVKIEISGSATYLPNLGNNPDAPNNGTPRPGIMDPFVAKQNAQFNQCVKSGTQVITRLAEVNGFLNPDDYTNDSKQAANSRDLQVDCLKQNPLAALSPNYSGMYGPASPAVVGIFSSNWF
jgi:hypothetical protein